MSSWLARRETKKCSGSEVTWKEKRWPDGRSLEDAGELDLGKTNTDAKVQYGMERSNQD